jgi:hypothetical protein
VLPEEVPSELVEQADLALAAVCNENEIEHGAEECICPSDDQIRTILAAVLPDRDELTRAKLMAELEWLIDARAEYGRPVESEISVLRLALEIMNGSPHYTGFLPSWWWSEWERRRGKPKKCNCGYGGFHEPENPRCDLNKKG